MQKPSFIRGKKRVYNDTVQFEKAQEKYKNAQNLERML